MIARRAAWGLWLLLAAALHLFGHSAGTRAILLASLLYTLAAPVATAVAARSLRASARLFAPENGRIAGEIRVQARLSRLCRVECALRVRNRFTGEAETAPLFPNGRGPLEFAVLAARCGVLEIALDSFRVSDPLGLFARVAFPCLCERRLIPPELHRVSIQFGSRVSAAPGARSEASAGFDPGETRALRAYIPGDSLHSVHWKLTEKVDRLLVRELDRPAGHSVLLLLAAVRPTPGQAAAMAEALLSISRSLAREGYAHTLGWYDAERGEDARLAIESEDDALGAAQALLSCPTAPGAGVTVDEASAYAHTLVVCDMPLENAFPGRVTLLPLDAGDARRYETLCVE